MTATLIHAFRNSIKLDAAHELKIAVQVTAERLLMLAGQMEERWYEDKLPRDQQLSIARKMMADLGAALASYDKAGRVHSPDADATAFVTEI